MDTPPTTTTDFQYAGSELALFALAHRWKAYWSVMLRRFVAGAVLEVGAGIGSNVRPLLSDRVKRWTALEPDAALVGVMRQSVAAGELPANCHPVAGILADLPVTETFDSIVYIDVMEHIADDRAEVIAAASRLAPGGRLVVLVPAHQFLFSAFDTAIGHYRRYNRASLLALAPPGCKLEVCRMLDSVGFFASLANKLLLRTALPTAGQILFWDRVMVPLSRRLDPLLGYRFGKTLVAVWSRGA